MPEGDTLFRTAAGLRPYLVGRTVTAARAQGPGPVPQVQRVVGATVDAVESHGKNLLIRFDNGLELRTHLRMNGSWHRYRPGERWRRPPARARLVLEVPGAVAVCFERRSSSCSRRAPRRSTRRSSRLGPDLLDARLRCRREALRRLRDPARAAMSIAPALLDQRALAGIGNICKNEMLFAERVEPFAPVAEPRRRDAGAPGRDRPPAARRTAHAAPRVAVADAGLRRAGRPCPRCGTLDPVGAAARRGPAHDVLVPDLPGDGPPMTRRSTSAASATPATAGAASSRVARRPAARRATT